MSKRIPTASYQTTQCHLQRKGRNRPAWLGRWDSCTNNVSYQVNLLTDTDTCSGNSANMMVNPYMISRHSWRSCKQHTMKAEQIPSQSTMTISGSSS